MAINFQEYVDAIARLATKAAMSTGIISGDPKAKAIVEAYNAHLKSDAATKSSPDDWSKQAENINKIPQLVNATEEEKKAAIKTAKEYLNADDNLKEAQEKLFENGKYVMKKAEGIFGMLGDFFKQNPITLVALGLGAVAGNALGFGMIGTLLFAAVSAVAGGALGDVGRGGLIPKFLNLKPHGKKEPHDEKTDLNNTQTPSKQIKVDLNDKGVDLKKYEGNNVSIEITDQYNSVMNVKGKIERDCEYTDLIVTSSFNQNNNKNSELKLPEPLKIRLDSNGTIDIKSIQEEVLKANNRQLSSLVENARNIETTPIIPKGQATVNSQRTGPGGPQ